MARKQRNGKLEMQNAAKTLLANIRFASVDTPVSSLVITSSIPGEGKSTVSIALSEAIAASGRTVLLVECDMRMRTLSGRLGVHAQGGIYSVLSEQMRLEDVVVPVSDNMYFLDVEPHIPNPADLLSSKRFRALVDRLENAFDYVVFDTPPVGTFVDAAILSSLADGTVMVVRQNYVKRDIMLEAHEQLKKAGANVIGVALNGCEMGQSEYYYAYYNAEGERVNHEVDPSVYVAADVRRVGGRHGGDSSVARGRSGGRMR